MIRTYKHQSTVAEKDEIADVEAMTGIDFDDDDWERDYIAAIDKANGAIR